MSGGHRMHGDSRIAELHATHDSLDPADHGMVAAPVGEQRRSMICVVRGVEIAENVCPAEGVDGLLRIADEDQGAMTVEGGLEDRPLGRVGVLELVDEDQAVAFAQPPARLLAGRGIGQCPAIG